MTQHHAPAAGGNDPFVLAFVGENANGILAWWTRHILEAFGRRGLASHLIDMTAPGWRDALSERLSAGKPEFCFSFQGFGMNLRTEGGNFWSASRIPFLSYLGDNPYHAPVLHAAEGQGLQLLYSCDDFLRTYRAMGGPLVATTMRYGFPANPRADAIPWGARGHGVVFVKTGVNPAALRSAWEGLPRAVARALHEASAEILSGADLTVMEACAAAFGAGPLRGGVDQEVFLSACSNVDFHVRAVRAERMVRALMRHEATIVGDWSHLDRAGARARFHAPLGAGTLDALYANARVVANTSPSVRRGMHERIMSGLFAKAAVLSDTTPFLGELLAPCPSFVGVGIDGADFPDRLDDALERIWGDEDMPLKVERSAVFAEREFGLDGFVADLLERVALERHRQEVEGWWAFPPARSRGPASLLAAG